MHLQNIIHAMFYTPRGHGRWGLAPLFWGLPGIGKSDITEQFADNQSVPLPHRATPDDAIQWQPGPLPCETLSPGERGEGAFGVTPVPEGGYLSYPPPAWTARFFGDGAGLVFVDEINTAPPALQPALLGLALRCRIGAHYLGPRVRVFAAANPVDMAAGGWDLPPALANRFLHFDWPVPTVAEWTEWMLTNGGDNGHNNTPVDVAKEEARVMALWPHAYAKAKGMVIGFHQARPNVRVQVPKPDDPKASRAWPSLRTWEFATRALASSDVHGLPEVSRDIFLEACVGTAAAAELMEWLKNADLPDPKALLYGHVKWQHNSARPDRTAAVLAACTAFLEPQGLQDRVRLADTFWRMINPIVRTAADLTWPSVQALNKLRLGPSAFPEDDNPAIDPMSRLTAFRDAMKA